MAGRDKRDLAGVTLLGNQNTKYQWTMHRKYWNLFRISTRTMIILLNSTARNLPVFVR